MTEGRVTLDGETLSDNKAKVKAGETIVAALPPPAPATPQPEAIALEIVFEDADLIVVNKPAGMAAHPAPGNERGTLVNALLHHCAGALSGVGGEARPGIVHRIDKETSGVLVVAKNDLAHQGLSAQFAAHDLERSYLALCHGAPSRADPRLNGLPAVSFEPGAIRIDAAIARHGADRKKMAVAARGKRAVTRIAMLERFGDPARPMAALLECRLETGRTHQIRVHCAHIGHPLIGDPVYGRNRRPAAGDEEARAAIDDFSRQALHAATLGFIHPRSGAQLRFSAEPPEDFAHLLATLRKS